MRSLRRRCFSLTVAVCCMMFYVVPFFVFDVELDHAHSNIYKRETLSISNEPAEVGPNEHWNSGGTEARSVGHLSQNLHPEPTAGTTAGKLNFHQWDICGKQVNTLRYWPFFPCLPDEKTFVTTFEASTQGQTGQRIFGYIIPPSTGKYQFVLTSPCCSELWLSTDKDPRKVRLIAAVDNNSTRLELDGNRITAPAEISGQIVLTSGQKYFIEVLHKGDAERGAVTVLWKQPAIERFTKITEPFIHPYCPDIVPEECGCIEDELKELWHIPSHATPTIPPLLTEEEVEYFYQVKDFSQEHLRGLLDVVPYNPTYVVKDGNINVTHYGGIKIANMHLTSVYPIDDTWISNIKARARWFKIKLIPNEVLKEALVQKVVKQFLSALKGKYEK